MTNEAKFVPRSETEQAFNVNLKLGEEIVAIQVPNMPIIYCSGGRRNIAHQDSITGGELSDAQTVESPESQKLAEEWDRDILSGLRINRQVRYKNISGVVFTIRTST
ncbi:MAG: hypothetical protein ABIJ33_05330 [Patescibacteria group bacterium]